MDYTLGQRVQSDPKEHPKVSIPISNGFEEVKEGVRPLG